MLFSELKDLEDILESIVFEDEPSIFNEDNAVELIETAFHLMEEYMAENPTAITEPDFHETLLEEIKEIFYIQMEENILENFKSWLSISKDDQWEFNDKVANEYSIHQITTTLNDSILAAL